MFKIRWTRNTGESGVSRNSYKSSLAAQGIARLMERIDTEKGRRGEYKYEIFEIDGNGAEITK